MQMSFVAAMKNYFGFQAGEGPSQFAKEIKTLDNKDRQEYAAMLRKAGIDCADPSPVPESSAPPSS